MIRAKEFAKEKHKNHFRRDGVTPYFNHLEDVANLMEAYNKNHMRHDSFVISVAYLHDCVEDLHCNLYDIENEFDSETSRHVDVLTHKKSQNYEEYIKNIKKAGDSFCVIKIADILSNLSDNPTEKQVKKYAEALKILLGYKE
jgi:(p)ppGpp synthase/HD superfamily hydrolase